MEETEVPALPTLCFGGFFSFFPRFLVWFFRVFAPFLPLVSVHLMSKVGHDLGLGFTVILCVIYLRNRTFVLLLTGYLSVVFFFY